MPHSHVPPPTLLQRIDTDLPRFGDVRVKNLGEHSAFGGLGGEVDVKEVEADSEVAASVWGTG